MREITLNQILLTLVLVVVIGTLIATLMDPATDDGLPPPSITGIEIQGLDHPVPRTAVARVELRKLSPAPAPDVLVTFALRVDDGSSAAPVSATLTAAAEPAEDDAPCEWSCFEATVTFDADDLAADGFAGFDRIDVTATTTSGEEAEPVEAARIFVYSSASATFVPADAIALSLDTLGLSTPGSAGQPGTIESCTCGVTGNKLRARLPFRRRFATTVEIAATPYVTSDLDGDGLGEGVCVELEDRLGTPLESIAIASEDLGSQAFHARGPAMGGTNAPPSCVQFGRLDTAGNCVAAGFRPPVPGDQDSENCLSELDTDCDGAGASAAFAVALRTVVNGVALTHDDKITVLGDTRCHNCVNCPP